MAAGQDDQGDENARNTVVVKHCKIAFDGKRFGSSNGQRMLLTCFILTLALGSIFISPHNFGRLMTMMMMMMMMLLLLLLLHTLLVSYST